MYTHFRRFTRYPAEPPTLEYWTLPQSLDYNAVRV